MGEGKERGAQGTEEVETSGRGGWAENPEPQDKSALELPIGGIRQDAHSFCQHLKKKYSVYGWMSVRAETVKMIMEE